MLLLYTGLQLACWGLDIRQHLLDEGTGVGEPARVLQMLARAGGSSWKPDDTAKKAGPQ